MCHEDRCLSSVELRENVGIAVSEKPKVIFFFNDSAILSLIGRNEQMPIENNVRARQVRIWAASIVCATVAAANVGKDQNRYM